MSDVMLFGVLRMPYELAMSTEMSRYQFWQRAQEALDRIEDFREAELTDDQIDAIFDIYNEAPTMLYRYLVARDIEKTIKDAK